MPALHLDQIGLPHPPLYRLRFRIWREWCFLRMVLRQMGWRVGTMIALLLGAGLLFQHFEPQKHLSVWEATYYAWSLVFGEPPEAFPQAAVLRVLFFLMPVLGLTVILEGILNLAMLLRDRRRYEPSWCRVMAASMSNHIILVGMGRLGYRAFRLLRRLGEPVVVVESNPNNPLLEEVRRDGSPLIIGNARDDAVLAQANVPGARSVIAATNDDLANLEIALDARQLHPGIRVVLRMFDQALADKVRDGFNIEIAMSQAAMSAPAFALAAVNPSIVGSFVVGGRLIVMKRWVVRSGGPFEGRSVGEVMKQLASSIVELHAGGAAPVLFPDPNTVLRPGDRLLVQGPYEVVSKFHDLVPTSATNSLHATDVA
ncbi:MAG: potassium channel protein [Phycisphaerae bacterium]|nr:potassium channel protein [Phycisphaerae bacterium]